MNRVCLNSEDGEIVCQALYAAMDESSFQQQVKRYERVLSKLDNENEDELSTLFPEVSHERERQITKWNHHSFQDVVRHMLDDREIEIEASDRVVQEIGKRTMATVLGEEVGEVNRAILESDNEGLRKELIQVATVALAFVSYLDKARQEQE